MKILADGPCDMASGAIRRGGTERMDASCETGPFPNLRDAELWNFTKKAEEEDGEFRTRLLGLYRF